MYQCAHSQLTDPATLLPLMREHLFATLVTIQEGVPTADHVPLLADLVDGQVVLSGHVARVNPAWRAESALAIFHGPHAFISADWYAEPDTVPTWNYQVVHARGALTTIVDDAGVRAVLDRLADVVDPGGAWRQRLSPQVAAGFRTAIVAFRIAVSDLRGIAKLSQHHTPERRQRTIAALRASGQAGGPAIAAAMAATLGGPLPPSPSAPSPGRTKSRRRASARK